MYNQDIKNKLYNLGVYPTVGVRGSKGDKGDSLKIFGSYESYEELVKNHPTGIVGDCYLINGILYFWNDEKGIWDEVGKIIGPTGPLNNLPTSYDGIIFASFAQAN